MPTNRDLNATLVAMQRGLVRRFLSGLVSLVVLTGCAGGVPETRMGPDGAVNLDAVARRVAFEYRERCFEPIAERRVPNDMCQFRLFESAERQWGTGFGHNELKATANRILTSDIEVALLRLLNHDKPSQRYVAQSFQTRAQILAALAERYKIR